MSDGIDPRSAAIARRLSGVGRVIVVTGGKGGIGKSVTAALLALGAARRGHRVGLFDLDLTSPSAHVVLGGLPGVPEEEYGVEPVDVAGVSLMSVACFAGDTPAPLRGTDITNALLELLAITRWGELDLLLVDMPPGLGDATLDVLRYLPAAEFLVVAGGSRLVLASVERALRFLTEQQRPVLGVVENRASGGEGVAALAARYGVTVAGSVPFDGSLESAIGDPARLVSTAAFRALDVIGERVIR